MSRSMQSAQRSLHRNSHFSMPSVVTLALWRLRQTWFLLFITTLGMIAAVIITCAIPLFSDVMTTAGMRNTLAATPTSAEISVNTSTRGLSTSITHTVHDQLDGLIRQNLGSLAQQTQFDIMSSDFSFVAAPKPHSVLTIYGVEMPQAAAHIALLQGRSTQLTGHPMSDIEVMVTPEMAAQLEVKAGSTFKVQVSYFPQLPDPEALSTSPTHTAILTAHVVGIFTVDAANSAYWHGENFKPSTFATENTPVYNYTLLVSNDALLTLSDTLSSVAHTDATYASSLDNGYSLSWYYQLDTARIFNRDLDRLIDQLTNLQVYLNLHSNNTNTPNYPYVSNISLYSPLFATPDAPGNLERFRSRVDVARIPVIALTLQILALILFFIGLITNLLVDRQAETIALLRSRGASSLQIFGALLTQSLVLGLLAIIAGVPLAILTVIMLAQRILPASELNALNLISANPLQTVQQSIWYALAIALIAIVTMGFSLFFATRVDILAHRRDSTRTHKRPIWQRFNLDVIAGVIALVGYGLSLYLSSIGSVIQGDAKTLITTPLSIIAPFFLILGCILLFLRLFPFLLRLGAFLAARGRGAVSLLALIQIARSPRQSIRMTMLLALAVAFALFTLVFTATQSQHIQDISTYLTGADFSGGLAAPTNNTSTFMVPAQVIHPYRAIPGVLAASSGYSTSGLSESGTLPIEIRAVDTSTFADAVIWPSQQDYQAAKVLLAQLQLDQTKAITTNQLPVIVDANVLDNLQLQVGSTFIVKEDTSTAYDLHCVIIGTTQHIPTVNDRLTISNGNSSLRTSGGVLVDYQSYSTVYLQQIKQQKTTPVPTAPQINHVWIHSKDDAASLASVRTALTSKLYLENLSDRRALLASLTNDPLYVIIGGVLAIGTITALLLALVGDLLASWLSARTRLTNFAVLRALGTTPQQVTGVLIWEQGIVYITGLLLGVAFGITFALTVIPSLTFTDLNTDVSSDAFYSLQSSLPTQVIIPSTLPIALLVLALIFLVALMMMVRVVSRPSLNQTLRLNED